VTRIHTNHDLRLDPRINYIAWNFPFTGSDEDDSVHQELLLGTFLSLDLFFGWKESVTGTLQGDQFSQWSVLRSARLAWWSLTQWGTFNCDDFPRYHPCCANGEPFLFEHPRFYIFELKPNVFR
jgi:Domain of unknown function (DUF2431)